MKTIWMVLIFLLTLITLPSVADECVAVAFWDDGQADGVRTEVYKWSEVEKLRNEDHFIEIRAFYIRADGEHVNAKWTEDQLVSVGKLAGGQDVRITRLVETPARARRDVFRNSRLHETGKSLSTELLETHGQDHDAQLRNIWWFLTPQQRDTTYQTRAARAGVELDALGNIGVCP